MLKLRAIMYAVVEDKRENDRTSFKDIEFTLNEVETINDIVLQSEKKIISEIFSNFYSDFEELKDSLSPHISFYKGLSKSAKEEFTFEWTAESTRYFFRILIVYQLENTNDIHITNKIYSNQHSATRNLSDKILFHTYKIENNKLRTFDKFLKKESSLFIDNLLKQNIVLIKESMNINRLKNIYINKRNELVLIFSLKDDNEYLTVEITRLN